MHDPDIKLLIGLVVVVALGAAGWYFRDLFLPEPEPVAEVQPAAAEPEVDAGPKYPVPDLDTDVGAGADLVPLPSLDDSDAYFLLEIGATLGSAIEALLVREAVIDRLVTTIDNLPRDRVPEKIRPVGQLQQSFRPDAGEPMTLGPASYARYDALVAQVANADIHAILDMYQRFYPLFQKAYQRLGYPDAYFNDRLVEVIDHLLATPEPAEPIVLTRPNVLYEFADPDLEDLSSGQKLLLRMGPDNAATVRNVLTELRAQLVR